MSSVKYWTSIYSTRHGTTSVDVVFDWECRNGLDEAGEIANLGDDFEPERGEWVQVDGPHEVSFPDGTEIWYTWRVLATVEGEEQRRLLVPWSDPHEYEFPFDFLFATPEAAREGLKLHEAEDAAREEGWVLCREILHLVAE